MTDNRFDNPYVNPEVSSGDKQDLPLQNVYQPQEVSVEQMPVEEPAEEGLNQPPYSCEWYGGNTSPINPAPKPPYVSPQTEQIPQKKERKQKGVSKGLFFAGIAVCLCLSFVAGFVGTGVYNYIDSLNAEIKNGLTINKIDAESYDTAYKDGGLSTVEIVNKAADSVVEITTETVTTGVFAQQFIKSGAGSGVIVDADGSIVTNHHVIDGATKISVTLRDGTTYDAKLVGSDEELDVALLEITPDQKLTAATFGDSDILMVGQRTVAIGNPLGQLGGSVTEGVLSALNRDVVIDGQTMSLLQTDTAINPGNSGGGLFDQNGNLIGIVNAKSSGSEVEGLGFAIPINDVINVIGDLAEFGYVRGRVDLGMTFIDVDSQQVAWMYGLEKTGCYIYSVEKNTNADVAGFESGDRVISVNGKEVAKSEELEKIINDCAVGEEVTFKVENTSGKTYTISFELQEYVPEVDNENFFEKENQNNDFSNWWSFFN
ncbi:MAG: trypsin-like peptidase domain-containing protein [Ruminococcus sp.]|nr:trypsin-like peptidase domain-containing protein [Ruminococcus sp.]